MENDFNGTVVNYTVQTITSNWTNYTLQTNNSHAPGLKRLRIFSNESSNNWGATNYRYINFYGFSEINESSYPQLINTSSPIITTCRVRDKDSNMTVQNYQVSFYKNGSLLGANTTDSNGLASFTFSDTTPETILIKCNITNATSLYYYASTNNQKNTTMTVNDAMPPTWSGNASSIPSTYSASTKSYFNVTWTDNANISTVLLESNYSGVPENYTMISLGNGTYSYNSTLPAGTFYWKSYANDTSNNWNSSDIWNFTINAAPQSTLPSSGGASTVSTTPHTTQPSVNASNGKVYTYVQELVPGEPIAVPINGSSRGLTGFVIYVNSQANFVSITLDNVSQLPSNITQPNGTPYRYWHFSDSLNDSDISNVTLNFTVNRTWMEENNISLVVLQRYSSGQWTNLSTTKISEDSNHVYYSSVSPGLSYFSITGQSVQPSISQPSTQLVQQTNQTTQQPANAPKPLNWLYMMVSIAAVVVAISIAFMTRLGKKKSRRK